MNVKIKLEAQTGRLLNREPFLVAENEGLTLEVVSDYNAAFLVSLKNGERAARLSGATLFKVPRELLIDGLLEATVCLYKDGCMLRRWAVEPIRIISHEETFSGHAEFEEIMRSVEAVPLLRAEIEVLRGEVKELREENEKIKQTVQETAEIVFDPLN